LEKKQTIRETVAVLVERVDNLIKCFNKFETKQEELMQKVIENVRNLNDLSHEVAQHSNFITLFKQNEKAKLELSRKWKLTIAGTLISALASLIVQVLVKVI